MGGWGEWRTCFCNLLQSQRLPQLLLGEGLLVIITAQSLSVLGEVLAGSEGAKGGGWKVVPDTSETQCYCRKESEERGKGSEEGV